MKVRRRFVAICLILALAGVVLVILVSSRQPRLYRMTILPSLGGAFTLPCAINDRGQVAGVSKMEDGAEHLFLWDRKKGIQDLGPVVNTGVQINDVGQIAATMRDANDCNRAFLWDPNSGRHVLPTLGGDDARAWAINNLGQIIGYADTAAGGHHAFVWDAAHGMRDLTPSSAKSGRAFSINDAGQVVVFAGGRPLLVSAKEDEASPAQPPIHSVWYVNNAGAVVGMSGRVKGKTDIVVWHPDSGTKKVAQLKGSFPGIPKMNDAGQVLFWQGRRPRFTLFGRKFFSTGVTNYLWDARQGEIALDGYVSVGRGEDFQITDLNDHGCLVGAVESREGGRSRGVLLEPITERWGD